jgi:hypothetical protein
MQESISMIRVLAAALLAVLPVSSRADETVVRLNVERMAAPKPALKYLLLPEVRELNAGNPVQWYIRCFQEQRNFFFSKQGTTERARYRSASLAELRKAKLANYGGSALRQADWGARLTTPDWEIIERVQKEGTSFRLPEIEAIHELGIALQVRFRGAVADARYEDAVSNIKTMFALARHLGQCPAGDANRVGLSIAGLCLDTMEEMFQQPGCPNLYWALTDLPNSLVDIRKGFQGDSVRAAADLRQLRYDTMTEDQISEVVSRLSGTIGFLREQAGLPPRTLRVLLNAAAKNEEKVRAARERLVKAERKEQPEEELSDRAIFLQRARRLMGRKLAEFEIRKLPPAQVVLLDEKLAFEERRDERMKLLALAPLQIDRLVKDSGDAASCLLCDLLPDVVKTRKVQARLEQRLALLRCVEALRMHAAAHDGKLPANLADCSVPVPDDPFSGRPFRYEVDGKIAHLGVGTAADRAKTPVGEVRYEISVK